MSFWKKFGEMFKLKCSNCHAVLDTSRTTSLMFAAEAVASAAYKCRGCGRLYCTTCAETIPCKECGGKVFDLA